MHKFFFNYCLIIAFFNLRKYQQILAKKFVKCSMRKKMKCNTSQLTTKIITNNKAIGQVTKPNRLEIQ